MPKTENYYAVEAMHTVAGTAIATNRQQQAEYQEPVQSVPRFTSYHVSVVVPTRNERDNIRQLLTALSDALRGLQVEVIFVDDSDDDTPNIIKQIALQMKSSTLHIHLEHRHRGSARQGGLATAVTAGLSLAQAEYIAVIDADLQHPPAQLRVLYDQTVTQQVDIVVASRYIHGGSYQGLDGIGRRLISVGFKWTAKILFPEHLLRLSDPLGGFFLLRRDLLTAITLRPIGYKILLEILLRCPWRYALEVPYHFQARAGGQSKANRQQGIMALQHMLRIWREVPAAGRFWKISLVLLLNMLIAFTIFALNMAFSPGWIFNTIIFAIVAGLDFLLFTRVLFPPTRKHSRPLVTPRPEDTMITPPPLAKDDAMTTPPAWLDKDMTTPSPDGDRDTVKVSANNDDDMTTPPVEKSSRITSSLANAVARKNVPTIASPATPTGAQQPKLEPTNRKKKNHRALTIVTIVTLLLAVGWISATLPGMLSLLAVLFIGPAILLTKRIKPRQAITMLTAIAVGVVNIDYLSWRFAVTNWQGWWIAIPLLFAECLGSLSALGFQFTVWPWSPVKKELRHVALNAPIFIFIPTVNEGTTILRQTLKGAIAARNTYLRRYPHEHVTIVLCNDGRVAKVKNWQETERLATQMGVACVTRTVGGGAKAGNIEHARQLLHATNDALIVIFDADQIARPDFLLKTIPPFQDQTVGWVQTGQYYSNLDNPVARWANDQQAKFYEQLCPGKAALNAAFICGTNVVIRAAALDAIGGLPQNSVTEDFAASIALHASWRSIYLTDVLATGLGPMDVPSYLKQQHRWAIGTMGVFLSHWRDILLPKKQGLKIEQRIQYFLACTHYLCGLRDLIYLFSPIIFICTGIPAVRSATLNEFLWHFAPYCLLNIVATWFTSEGGAGIRSTIIGFGSFPVLVESLLSVIFRRKIGFSVTAKQRAGKRSLRYIRVYVVCLLFCIGSLLWATQTRGEQQTSLFISILWVTYSICMLGGFFWLIMKDLRFQGTTATEMAGDAHPARLQKQQNRRGMAWKLGLALLIASPILVSNLTTFASGPTTPFVVGQAKSNSPYLGITLPVQWLTNRPSMLEQTLDTHFSIIGRTQDIHDWFDSAWADQLAAQQIRPWITLQFGVFDAHQQAPLDANLPAIINGLHDQDIIRWANEIRNYGKPVYLTILLHADRNWSLSSGVANGGLPQDISKAWLHVQSLFHAAGANNVAWVWAPADPIHDQAFAPPQASIDLVLQSFIEYPQTSWSNPTATLQLLSQHYPTKPIMVEASIDGPASQKASWLLQLGQAIKRNPQVYALLYHEGGPSLTANPVQMQSWSLASDTISLAAMKRVVLLLQNEKNH